VEPDALETNGEVKYFEADTHSFIVRVWREARENELPNPEWRGEIEHVPGGERRGLRDLDEIASFIAAYIKNKGLTRVQESGKRLNLRKLFLRRRR
jgi:hypothetical protein